jgi:hypothetical protein
MRSFRNRKKNLLFTFKDRNLRLCLQEKSKFEDSGEKVFVEVKFKYKGWTNSLKFCNERVLPEVNSEQLRNRQDWKSHVLGPLQICP